MAAPGVEILPPSERSRLYTFAVEDCEACPQRAACLPKQAQSRTIDVRPNEALFVQARDYQGTEEYRRDRQTRQIAERQIARMVKLGARVARVFGLAKVRAQTAMIAVVVNLTRLCTLQATAA